jgi:hypothetical protein
MFFCPMSWLIAIVVTRIARWVPLVEQDLFTIPEHMRSSPVFVLFLLGIAFLFTGHWFHCTFTRMKTTIDGGCLIRSRNCLLFASTWVHPHFLYCGFLVCLFLFCVCPVLPLSLVCSFLIIYSMFSKVDLYLMYV